MYEIQSINLTCFFESDLEASWIRIPPWKWFRLGMIFEMVIRSKHLKELTTSSIFAILRISEGEENLHSGNSLNSTLKIQVAWSFKNQILLLVIIIWRFHKTTICLAACGRHITTEKVFVFASKRGRGAITSYHIYNYLSKNHFPAREGKCRLYVWLVTFFHRKRDSKQLLLQSV